VRRPQDRVVCFGMKMSSLIACDDEHESRSPMLVPSRRSCKLDVEACFANWTSRGYGIAMKGLGNASSAMRPRGFEQQSSSSLSATETTHEAEFL
jgi:hypothetical protein